MTTLDNQDNNLFPLTLDGLNYISVNGLNLNDQAGVLQATNDGSVYADYNVRLDQITPASAGNTIDIAGNTIIDNKLALNGAPISGTYAANITGDVNVSGDYYINGAPLSGGLWSVYPSTSNIYRNSNVGIGDFTTSTTGIIYPLQLGPIDTTAAIDKTLSIPVAFDRNSKIRLSECGPSGTATEAGFDLQLNGANNRLEILSGANAVPPNQAFSTRSLTIDRSSGNACFGSVINTNNPLSVTSSATQSRQLNVVGATNSSLAVNNASGNLDVCVAGGTGAFSTDAVAGDGVIRLSTASRKLLLQCGTATSGICIDQANNVGISKSTGLGTYKLDVLGGIGSQNSSITCYTNTTTSSAGFRLLLSGQTSRTGLFSTGVASDTGFQLLANDLLAVTGSSIGNVGIGTAPHSTFRFNVDGSSRFSGNVDVVGGNQYRVSGVQLNTSHIPENTNLYYTTARATTDARAAISASGTAPLTLTYDNLTGVLTGSITGSAISKWLDAVSGGIYRNSRIAVNFTDTRSDSVIYSRTDPTNSITAGLYIESPTTSGAQIIQKTSSVQFAHSASSPGYKIINQTPASNNNWFGVNTDGTFELYNGNTTNGTEFKFFDGTNLGLPGTGAEIFYGPSTDRTLYFINQESTNSSGIQFWTNDTALDERWRINKNGSLTNKKATTTKIFDINGEARIGNSASPNFYVSFGQPSGTTVGDGCYIQGTSNAVNFINQQSGDLNLGTNNEITLKLKQSSTESALEVGSGTTTNKYAYLDLIGDTTYSDHGLRIIRDNTGANTTSRIVHRGTGNLEIKVQEAGALTLFTTNSERMRILSGGNVGINNTNPEERLTVNVATSNYSILGSDGTRKWGVYLGGNSNASIGTKTNHSWGFFTNNGTVTAYFSVSTFYATAFTVISDERIKKDIEDVDDGEALVMLRQLKPKKYKYIDPKTNNNVEEKVWGFLSQDVQQVIPHSTIPQTGIIPNIMKNGHATQINETQIKVVSIDAINVAVDDIIEIRNDNFGRTFKVIEIISPYIFIVENSENILNNENEPITIVGKQVNDKLFLKKDSIYTVGIASIQELDRQVQQLKQQNEYLQNELANTKMTLLNIVQQLNLKGLGIKI